GLLPLEGRVAENCRRDARHLAVVRAAIGRAISSVADTLISRHAIAAAEFDRAETGERAENRLLRYDPAKGEDRERSVTIVRTESRRTVGAQTGAGEIPVGQTQVRSGEVRDQVVRLSRRIVGDDGRRISRIRKGRTAEALTFDEVQLGLVAFGAGTDNGSKRPSAAAAPRVQGEETFAHETIAGVVARDRITADSAVLVNYEWRAPKPLVKHELVPGCSRRELGPVRQVVTRLDVGQRSLCRRWVVPRSSSRRLPQSCCRRRRGGWFHA